MEKLRDRLGSGAPRLGQLAETCGQVGFAIAVGAYVVDLLYSARTGTSLWVTPFSLLGLWTLALGLAWLMIKLIQFGRRLQVPTADEVLARDARPPVLYLRSFRDDDATHAVFERWLLRVNYRSEEEELAATFAEVGPLVAVGRPGEVLPHLGAARFYFRDDEWKDRVAELMAQASVVVLRVGGSRGLIWELERALTTLPPQKLVLLIGHNANWQTLLAAAPPALAEKLQALQPQATGSGVGSMRGFIVFDGACEPRYLPLRRRLLRWSLLHPYLYELRVALRSCFSTLALPWSEPPFPIKQVTIALLLGGLSILLQLSR
ncbi:hypothetical protein [Haliangium sp. UPWRP_2]|uniref:hypothetical protein n=1 Tax=Haliangium sp. UPWRP_2 TaxID=1931276 RepID=UPI000B53D241|nr:hypothetical protein [Haliangium sp. UPWRP_2]PSM32110.1 hypothetical protein BVG81_001855 [Haliangium sp. UPWRP_2]HNN94378.1 hypothetical protein [Pseudomonadota bacterium]